MPTSTVTKQWNGKDVKIKGKKITGKTMFEVGLIVEAQAKALCPVAWGYLRASITTQAIDKGTQPDRPQPSFELMKHPTGQPYSGPMTIAKPMSEWEVLVGTPLFYAPYPEFGTIQSDAQPFLRPALDLAKGRTLTIFEKNGRFEFREYLQ